MNTHPEVRQDKNGNFVTRHVKEIKDAFSRISGIPAISASVIPVSLGSATCAFCSLEFERGTEHSCRVNNLIFLTSAMKSVLRACHQAGGRPLIVGGSVRDAILNRIDGAGSYQSKDIDIEVHGIEDPELLRHHLSARGHVNLTGASFGVYKIRIGKEDFDISLPRKDSKTGKGHKGFEVEVDPSLGTVEAFGRRDFTINAMGYDVGNQHLVDPYGGTQDLADGILRHTTSAFSEDPLRVLRGVQFAARFGFELAPETVEESMSIKDDFNEIAIERVWGEFEKIFSKGIYISKAIDVLKETGWIEHFPELARLEDVPQDPNWHPEGNVLVHLGMSADKASDMLRNGTDRIAKTGGVTPEDKRMLVFAAMVHDFGKHGAGTQIHENEDGSVEKITSIGHPVFGEKPIRDFGERIGAPSSIIEPVVKLASEHMTHVVVGDKEPSSRAVRNLVRRLGDGKDGASLRNWAILVDADQGGRGKASSPGNGWDWYDKALSMNNTKPPKVMVDGRMLKDFGLVPGAVFRDIIDAARIAQDNEEFLNVADAEKWARAHVASMGLSPSTARIDPRL